MEWNQLMSYGCMAAAALYVAYGNGIPMMVQCYQKMFDQLEEAKHKSKPGDRCICCLEVMSEEDWHVLKCHHALHKECFEELRQLRNTCLICGKVYVYSSSQPGEICIICMDDENPLNIQNMTYLACNHALHESCLTTYKENGYRNCPFCRKDI
ncbi:uncharacterized protein Dwil_GK28077 [Drosophila willistoni]|uniref:RING-type domain-containing protein n=1 Tax=Drosophila willistoni TaxID=7260 RepID=A0A0Q9X3D5_DROWI|nr:uncharacterized protein LOC26530079 [Drosophila willistoni]KRF99437.1 uncharacterized protein Dwil_GK28077 [Drosophila willistoni]